MTIKKSYRFQIEHEDGSIEDVIFKGKTEPDARAALMQEYPDLSWYDWGDRLKLPRRDRLMQFSRVFYNSCRRGAQYIYQHKGRKKRNRRNYPTPRMGWRRPLGPMSFSFTETISMPMRNFFEKWAGLLAQDTGLTVPDAQERISKAVGLPLDLLNLPQDMELVGFSGQTFRITFQHPPCSLITPRPENDMQQQNEKTVPVIVLDSLGMLPEVQAEQEACPPCIPTSAIDELGRTIKNLQIDDRMVTKFPTDEELIASGDPNSPLTRALQCRVNGDYIGMMHNAAQVPGIRESLVRKGLMVDNSVDGLHPPAHDLPVGFDASISGHVAGEDDLVVKFEDTNTTSQD